MMRAFDDSLAITFFDRGDDCMIDLFDRDSTIVLFARGDAFTDPARLDSFVDER